MFVCFLEGGCPEEARCMAVLFSLLIGTFEGHPQNFRTQNSGIRDRRITSDSKALLWPLKMRLMLFLLLRVGFPGC